MNDDDDDDDDDDEDDDDDDDEDGRRIIPIALDLSAGGLIKNACVTISVIMYAC